MKTLIRFTVLLLAALVISQNVTAALVAGSALVPSRADQFVQVTEGSPLTGTPFFLNSGDILPISGSGQFNFQWDDDADGDNTVDFTGFEAQFNGTFPAPFSLQGMGSGPGATSNGQLTNIVESGGELVSADFTVNTTFSLTFDLGPGGSPTLYTKDLATFTGVVIDGSANIGEVYSSTGDLEVFLSLGGNPDNDPLAGISLGSNGFLRTVTAIPEPSSMFVLGLVASGAFVRRRR